MIDGAEGSTADIAHSFEVLAISVGLGGLVGLQRQQAESRIAGIRTFPLITVLGTLAGLVSQFNTVIGACMIVVSMLGVIVASGLGNYLRARPWLPASPDPNGNGKKEKLGAGITTEMAILVMYAVGVYLSFGSATVAVAITGVVVLLLYAKQGLHSFVARLGEKDVSGIMQFVLLTFVILPILPNSTFDRYGALNPQQIWLVVVLVAGISLLGYIAYKIVGHRAGTILSGLIGGMISSTATTASFAKRSTDGGPAVASSALLAIMLASTVVYARLFAEITAVAPQSIGAFAGPLGAMGASTALLTGIGLFLHRPEDGDIPSQQNPTNLRAAFLFAAIYAAVVLATSWAKEHLGVQGLYVLAGISGLSDMDAITLSSGRAVTDGRLDASQAWRAVMIALMASMLVKVIICRWLGSRALFRRALGVFSLNIAIGIAIVAFWPSQR